MAQGRWAGCEIPHACRARSTRQHPTARQPCTRAEARRSPPHHALRPHATKPTLHKVSHPQHKARADAMHNQSQHAPGCGRVTQTASRAMWDGTRLPTLHAPHSPLRTVLPPARLLRHHPPCFRRWPWQHKLFCGTSWLVARARTCFTAGCRGLILFFNRSYAALPCRRFHALLPTNWVPNTLSANPTGPKLYLHVMVAHPWAGSASGKRSQRSIARQARH